MSVISNNSDDQTLLLKTINDSLVVKTHFQLFSWLQGSLQHFLPHDILVSAWGDFSLGLIYLDIVALDPLIKTSNINEKLIEPKILSLFDLWQSHNNLPLTINIEDDYFNLNEALKSDGKDDALEHKEAHRMQAALLHGVKDNRGSYDCLYIMLSANSIPVEAKAQMRIFMPLIDCAFRQIQLLETNTEQEPTHEKLSDKQLTKRECDLMDLVDKGASNDEIAADLDISIYTVKNHLQRVYKKLDANNRLQAGFKYRTLKSS